jgi:hypothetical protein
MAARLSHYYFREHVKQLRATLDGKHGDGASDGYVRLFWVPKGREGFEPERCHLAQIANLPAEQDPPLGLWRVYAVEIGDDGEETIVAGTDFECDVYDPRDNIRNQNPERAAVRAAGEAIELHAGFARRASDELDKEHGKRLAAEGQVDALRLELFELETETIEARAKIAELEAKIAGGSEIDRFWKLAGPVVRQVAKTYNIEIPGLDGMPEEPAPPREEDASVADQAAAYDVILEALRKSARARRALPKAAQRALRQLGIGDGPETPDAGGAPQPPTPEGPKRPGPEAG